MTSNISRRHHTVPRFHLRNFASHRRQLTQLDVTTGRRTTVGVDDATVVKHFYTIVLPDGSQSDVWERRLGDIEALAAPAVRRAIDTKVWWVSDEDKDVLSLWVALQYLRGPDNRRRMAQHYSLVTRMQVGMGGLAYLRHAMSQGLGRAVSQAEAEQAWSDLTDPPGPNLVVSSDEHIETITRTIGEAEAHLRERTWGRIRFQRHALAISDAPVALVRGDTPDYLGVGLMNAPSITVPLDRHTLLWLDLPSHLRSSSAAPATYRDRHRDAELVPSKALAVAYNTSAILGAERFVFYHPDDDPVPAGSQWPRPAQDVAVVGPDMVNRDRPLDDVLSQIARRNDPNGSSLIADYTWPIPGHRPRP